MTIDDIIEVFGKYGFVFEQDTMPNLAWSMDQRRNGVKDEDRINKDDRVFRLKWKDDRNSFKNFTIFEQETVYNNGIKYEDKDRLFYFFSFGMDYNGKIYRDNELDFLMKDIHDELVELLTVSEIRELKLINLGV